MEKERGIAPLGIDRHAAGAHSSRGHAGQANRTGCIEHGNSLSTTHSSAMIHEANARSTGA